MHTAQFLEFTIEKDRIAVALQPLSYVGGVYLETSAYIPRYAKTLEKWGGGGGLSEEGVSMGVGKIVRQVIFPAKATQNYQNGA